MQEADIEGAAEHIALRPHSREAIKTALQRGWPVHVLSVNWSAALIRAALAGIPCRIVTEADAVDVDDDEHAGYVIIHANSLEMHLGISTGSFCAQRLALAGFVGWGSMTVLVRCRQHPVPSARPHGQG